MIHTFVNNSSSGLYRAYGRVALNLPGVLPGKPIKTVSLEIPDDVFPDVVSYLKKFHPAVVIDGGPGAVGAVVAPTVAPDISSNMDAEPAKVEDAPIETQSPEIKPVEDAAVSGTKEPETLQSSTTADEQASTNEASPAQNDSTDATDTSDTPSSDVSGTTDQLETPIGDSFNPAPPTAANSNQNNGQRKVGRPPKQK